MTDPLPLQRRRWYQHLVSLHYVLALFIWLTVESLLVIFLVRHVEGAGDLFKSLPKVEAEALWLYVQPLFQCGLLIQNVAIVYSIIEGECRGARLCFDLEECVRAIAVYFIAIPVLNNKLDKRSLLVVLNSWTLLNIFRSLKTIYNHKYVENVFITWTSHKSYVEMDLVRKSAKILKEMPMTRAYPSRMPNAYNFQFDMYQLYYVLPFLMVPFSAAYYVYRLQNRKLKYF
ncbi:hypothetical protein BgAZ_105500 [Babesia gibsoni]|uniref:Very-long-chain (3R)-3-hydroxyacyl-CoA dehydratase n=1 Tax=Babesia gibsoni TaxID=33632 RepID=A0AAD8UW12_BABGI|nr:hypothetical protein BgAZ_105500 [Babesia gibsoni]